MARLWNVLREEVLGTVDEFRQKGAIGALRDAALDTRDMATDAGSWLWGGVRELVAGDGQQPESEAVLRSDTVPQRGATAPLELPDGSIVEALVVDIDGVSEPPRARVTYPGSNEPLLVLVLAQGVPKPTPSREAGLLGNLKEEWNATVQDFREKGAVGAVRDAALDAVDMVGSTAKTAVSGARSLASPLLDLDWDESKAAPGTAAAGAAEASAAPAGEARGAATSFAPPPRAGGLLEGLKQEIRETVQDFREKGAVGAVKDAALDAVDLVGSTAAAVASGAASLARPVLEKAPLLPDLWAASPEPAAASGAPGAPPAAASEPIPAASSRAGPSATAASKDKEAPPQTASPTAGLLVPGPSPAAPPPAAAAPAAARAAPSQAASVPATATAAATSPGSAGAGTSPTGATSPGGMAPGTPTSEATSSDMPGAKPPRKSQGSLVSMRRNMFEKPKEDPKKEDKEAEEELLD